MQHYLKEQSVCCKASTIASYQTNLRCFHQYLKTNSSAKNPIASLTKKQIHDYLLHLCGKDLAPYTKVNYLLAIKKYLAWEVERGKLSEDLLEVLDRSKLPTVPEYLPKPLSFENDQKLQTKLKESKNPLSPLFLLLRQTGLRISELINLPNNCVLTGSKNEKYLKVPLGKMNNERLIPLCDESLALIENIRQRIAKIEQKKKYPETNRLIGIQGNIPHVYTKLSNQFKNIINNMTDQNKPVTFHRLRHTYATTLLTGGVSLPSLMKLLGHKRIEMTLRYAKVTPAHLRDEYLKAIAAIENKSMPELHQKNPPCQPVELVAHILAFTQKAAQINPKQKHALIQRLSRLKHDLNLINFHQHESL